MEKSKNKISSDSERFIDERQFQINYFKVAMKSIGHSTGKSDSDLNTKTYQFF